MCGQALLSFLTCVGRLTICTICTICTIMFAFCFMVLNFLSTSRLGISPMELGLMYVLTRDKATEEEEENDDGVCCQLCGQGPNEI